MDKYTKYALIGGAAIIGAAIAYHYSQKAVSGGEEDTLDEDLELIGEVQREGNGALAFVTLKKVMMISVFYGKKQFAAQKS